MNGTVILPRQELAVLTEDVIARGIPAGELRKIQELGSDGYGVVSQLEQMYAWLSEHHR